jgi:hypothetical protein
MQVEDTIVRNPGITLQDIIDRLYREEPWEQKRKAATGRARQALHRLQHDGRVVRKVDSAGAGRLYIKEQAHLHNAVQAPPQSAAPTVDNIRRAGWSLVLHQDLPDRTVYFMFRNDTGATIEARGASDTEALATLCAELSEEEENEGD